MVGMKKSRKIRRIHGPNGMDPEAMITIWQIWAENGFCQAVGWMLSGSKGDFSKVPPCGRPPSRPPKRGTGRELVKFEKFAGCKFFNNEILQGGSDSLPEHNALLFRKELH
jgi:hypothetical protein